MAFTLCFPKVTILLVILISNELLVHSVPAIPNREILFGTKPAPEASTITAVDPEFTANKSPCRIQYDACVGK